MSKVFSLEEVKKHNTASDCWMIVHNKVRWKLKRNPAKPNQPEQTQTYKPNLNLS